MQKTVVAVKGPGGTGKSATIKHIADMIKEKYPSAQLIEEKSTTDIFRILKIPSGAVIGIESEGDPKSRLPRSLDRFVQEQCNLIICATRVKGEMVKAVESLESDGGYNIIWVSTYRNYRLGRNHLNAICAKHLFWLVRELLGEE